MEKLESHWDVGFDWMYNTLYQDVQGYKYSG